MTKRITCIALATFMMIFSFSAYASPVPVGLAEFGYQQFLDIGPLSTAERPTFTQNCVVHVQVIHTYPDGSTASSVISPTVFTVTYKFQLYKRSGAYSGGEMLRGEWPKVNVANSSGFDLGVQAQRLSYPTNVTCNVTDTTYSFTVSGGLLEVTYYPTIYIAADGTVTHDAPVTQQRAFYGVFSGP